MKKNIPQAALANDLLESVSGSWHIVLLAPELFLENGDR
jgi:hypothetical protein